MDETVKKRLVGAIVLVALAVIFVPFLLEEKESPPQSAVELNAEIPAQPQQKFRSGLVPDEKTATQELIRSESQEAEFNISERLDLSEYKPSPTTQEGRSGPSSAKADDEQRQLEDQPAKATMQAPSSKPGKSKVETSTAKKQVAHKKGWIIQVGAFGKKSNADNIHKKLNNSGLSAYIEELKVKDKTLYLVRVGPFANKNEVQQRLKRVEKEFDLKGRVINLK